MDNAQRNISRRDLLRTTCAVTTAVCASQITPWVGAGQADESPKFRLHTWLRDANNPILAPGKTTFDATRCMNPFVLQRDGKYWMFYAGADKQRRHRICLAVASIDNLTEWKRLGPVLDLGGAGSFDENWCVLPCIHRFGDKWHLYYTGRSANTESGLQSFSGIGLAISDDLSTWKKTSDEPVLRGDGFAAWPNNQGIAGGGVILKVPQADDSVFYRMYYTLATGKPSKDPQIDQAKQSVIAQSRDGIHWFDKRVVLQPRPNVDYENCGVIGLNVCPTENGFRAVYAAIGTKFGAYSICEAVSHDGLQWNRGMPGENLSLPPTGNGWEGKMTTYPNLIDEGANLRLFYCGNGYGSTGIGTALAPRIA